MPKTCVVDFIDDGEVLRQKTRHKKKKKNTAAEMRIMERKENLTKTISLQPKDI